MELGEFAVRVGSRLRGCKNFGSYVSFTLDCSRRMRPLSGESGLMRGALPSSIRLGDCGWGEGMIADDLEGIAALLRTTRLSGLNCGRHNLLYLQQVGFQTGFPSSPLVGRHL